MTLSSVAATANAQCNREQELFYGLLPANGEFGTSVSVSGSTAIVGAPGDHGSLRRGVARIFRHNGSRWLHRQSIAGSVAEYLDKFGASVAVHGDVAVVGAPGSSTGVYDSGAAYVFRFDGTIWSEVQRLTGFPPADERFGGAVAMSGDVLVVGVATSINHGDRGAAYVFRFDGSSWLDEQKLTAFDPGPFDRFGNTVSVSGDTIIVGANEDVSPVTERGRGAAYVFRFDGTSWVDEQKLTAFDGKFADRFGVSVFVSGDVVLVGADLDDDDGPRSGSAYLFRLNDATWTLEQKLTASDARPLSNFGGSVSVSGDRVVIGAYRWSTFPGSLGTETGAAYEFRFDGAYWSEVQILTALDATEFDWFGYSVSVSAGKILAGAPMTLVSNAARGSAYFFPELEDCNINGTQDGADIDDGYSLDCNTNCIPDECETDPDDDGDGVINCNDKCPGVDDAIFAPECTTAIPTVSVWGLTVLALLLLIAAKLRKRFQVSDV